MKKLLGFMLLIFLSRAEANVTEWISFTVDNGAVVVPVTINGEKAKAVIDSTARANLLSSDFIAKNKSKLRQSGVTLFKDEKGERNAEVFKDVKVGVFGTELEFSELIATPESQGELVLGIPFFRQNIVQFDFPNKRMRLIGHGSIDMQKISNIEMKSVQDSRSASTPGKQSIKKNDLSSRALNIAINGKSSWLVLDTADVTGVSLSREYAKSVNAMDKPYSGDIGYFTAQFNSNIEVFSLASLKIGPYELEDVPALVEAEGAERIIPAVSRKVSTGTYLNKAILPDGVIGTDVMQHFVVTFDYSNSLVSFVVM